ncbi:MAG: dethiobiotin synthase, partial [Halomonas sp.]|nr:dethiobiotin synthase [Halomonas sp.]
LAGWVGSVVAPEFTANQSRFDANLALLNATLPAPCLGIIPHLASPEAAQAYPYLSLTPLLNAPTLHQEATQ